MSFWRPSCNFLVMFEGTNIDDLIGELEWEGNGITLK